MLIFGDVCFIIKIYKTIAQNSAKGNKAKKY